MKLLATKNLLKDFLKELDVCGLIPCCFVKVPKSAPESRQSYAGLTLNHATNVVVRDNMVKTELHQDYAFMACCGASIVGDSRDNKV